MAMMASASSGNPYDDYDNREIEQDLIDPDDGKLERYGSKKAGSSSLAQQTSMTSTTLYSPPQIGLP